MKQLALIFTTLLLLLSFVSPPEIPAVQKGDKVISFKQGTIRGETVDLDAVIGKKPVLLFFWATW